MEFPASIIELDNLHTYSCSPRRHFLLPFPSGGQKRVVSLQPQVLCRGVALSEGSECSILTCHIRAQLCSCLTTCEYLQWGRKATFTIFETTLGRESTLGLSRVPPNRHNVHRSKEFIRDNMFTLIPCSVSSTRTNASRY